ncbi:CHAD domain-containing protein [Mucilaginibacter paludis]|uniref:CHAD domain-containing protein n=1 Tax=Mucilaginibacter paludis DSM 18603 TaxID=714943 RepID=H1Y9N9_9SPHI|nr:CHAD domain-containing protein [Mucilaginibacter paludis]EHQ30541.1 hypothetical protein Mucpa_6488 [Mucilaginibacter paludis DSM 18603]
MKANPQKKQIAKQFKNIKAHVKQFIKSADQEELHQLRVGIKKLKAFLILLQSHSQNRHLLKRFEPVGKIFKKAGNIRNAHINLSLSDNYQLDGEQFINHQQELMDSATHTFRKDGKLYLKKMKEAKKNLLHGIHGLDSRYVQNFYRENIDAIAVYLKNIEFNPSLHDCRKKIKFLLYNYKLANKSLSRHLQLNTQYLDDLQESIGAWHDNVLALDLAGQVDPDNKTTLRKLQRSSLKLRKSIAILAVDFMRRATGIESDTATIQPS